MYGKAQACDADLFRNVKNKMATQTILDECTHSNTHARVRTHMYYNHSCNMLTVCLYLCAVCVCVCVCVCVSAP
jgi:hypothetical protein